MKKENQTSGKSNCHICIYWTAKNGCDHYGPQTHEEQKIQDSILNQLTKFVLKKPGFDPADYFYHSDSLKNKIDGIKALKADRRISLKDRESYFDILELLSFQLPDYIDLSAGLETYIKNSNWRITIDENNKIQYITGQYFPTEYRCAACQVLGGYFRQEFMKFHKFTFPDQMKNYFKKHFPKLSGNTKSYLRIG